MNEKQNSQSNGICAILTLQFHKHCLKSLVIPILVFIIIIILTTSLVSRIGLVSITPKEYKHKTEIFNVISTKQIQGKIKVGFISLLTSLISKHDVDILYMESRQFYMEGVDYFIVMKSDPERPSTSAVEKWIDGLNNLYPPNVGISLDIEDDFCFIFHRSHFDIFGNIYPRELTTSKQALLWLSRVYYDSRTVFNPDNITHIVDFILRENLDWDIDERIERDRKILNRYIAAYSHPELQSYDTERKVISMSLYGNSSRYTQGAIRNAQLVRIYFPGWSLRFYVDPKNKPSDVVLDTLLRLGADLNFMNDPGVDMIPPMMARFLVADDPQVDIFLIQDCDSRLDERLAVAVSHWLSTSNASFYCLRDHPSHSNYAVSGGLWGGRRKGFLKLIDSSMRDVMKQGYDGNYLQDMKFLGEQIWPIMNESTFCHDSFSCDRWPHSHAFPIARQASEHTGQVFNQFHIGRKGDQDILREAEMNPNCVPQSISKGGS